MNIKKKILSEFPAYTEVQKSIAKTILTHKKNIAKYNVKQFSELANVSASMVVNFSKKLGLDGWDELKYLVKYTFDEEHLKNNFLSELMDTLKETQECLLEESSIYKKMLKKLNKAKNIHIFSRSSSSSICFEFYYKFRKVRSNVFFHSKAIDQINAINHIEKDSLVIFVSNSADNIELENILLLNSINRQNYLLITTNPNGNLCKYFSNILVGANFEKTFNFYKDLPILSKYALSYILDSLFYDYWNLYREESEDFLIQLKTLINE